MALPANVTQTTVTGNLVWLDGSPAKGSVTFLPSIEYVLDAAADTNIYMYEHTEVLDENGHFDVALIATDDPDLNPVGWTYTVRILLQDPTLPESQTKPVETIFSMGLPAGPPVDIADVAPVQSSPGNAITKGEKGDPGQVLSVNGDDGPDVVLDAADVGAEPLGAVATVNSALNQHISRATGAHAASAVSFSPAAGVSATNVQAAIVESANDITAHVNSVGVVHNAGAISFAPAAGIAATTVQAAIVEDAGDLSAHLADTVDAHDASAISFVPGGTIAASNVQAAISEVATDASGSLSAHVGRAVDAHDASAISFVPAAGIGATDVQAAIVEAVTDAGAVTGTVQTNLTAHLNDTFDAHDASAISFVPGSGIAAVNVQAAIIEDATDLAAHLSDTTAAHAASAISFAPTAGIAANTVQAAIVEDAGDLANHLADLTDVHIASAIKFTPTGSVAAGNVQAAIAEVASEAVNANSATATNLASHLTDPDDAHDASAISFIPTGTIAATNVQAAIVEAVNEAIGGANTIGAHLSDTDDAHDASAISFVPAAGIAATQVQGALAELAGDTNALSVALAAHIDNATDAHDATAVSFTPTGSIAASTVQAAIVEVHGDIAIGDAAIAAHIADTTDVHAASAVSFTPIGAIAASNVQAAIEEVAADVTAQNANVDVRVSDHINDTTAAHMASSIGIADVAGQITATDVEGAFAENRALFNSHLALTTTAHGGLVPPTRTITGTAPVRIDGGASADLSANRTISVSASSETAQGIVELATTAETTTGTDLTRAVHPAGVKAALDARNIVSTTRAVNTSGGLTGGGALSSDLTLSVADNGITAAKLADMSPNRIKGRITQSVGDPEDLTGTQVTSLLDNFTTTLKGLVPPPATSTGKVLSDNGTWVSMLDQTAGDTRYVNVGGDTMTGGLTLPSAGVTIGSGGTVSASGSDIRISLSTIVQSVGFFHAGIEHLRTGNNFVTALKPVQLPADPGNPLEAATKQYVDNKAFVPTSRTLIGTNPIMIDGVNTALDHSANRTISVAVATTGAVGVTQLATTAEATGQTVTNRAVTPAGLADRVLTSRTISTSAPLSGGGDLTSNRTLSITSATETAVGAIEIATQAESDAGTDDARAVTPLKLVTTIAAKTLPKTQPINAQTGTSYTLALSDVGKLLTLSNAGAITLTIPNEATVNIPTGSFIDLLRYGLGAVTVAPQAPVAIRCTPSPSLRAQYSGATLVKIGTDEWSLVGDLA